MSEKDSTAKAKILLAMYRSVERLNRHVIEGNLDSAASEQHLQINLRKNFEELEEKENQS